MIFHPGLRHNKHMVRLLKTEDARTPYELGTAYGNAFTPVDDTERRRRILDQWCLPHQSPRRPESPSVAEVLPARTQRSYFHQLHDDTQALLSRRLNATPLDRRDALPGTKSRIQLGRDHGALKVESWPLLRSPQSLMMGAGSDARIESRRDAFSSDFGQPAASFIRASGFPARRS
jgi:hypothetical protein